MKYIRLPATLLSLSTRSGISVSFLLALSWNLTDFIPEKISSLQWEDPKVSVQLVDKRSSDGHFRIELNSSVCALLAIFALQTEDRGGRVNVCFHISTERSICLNRLQLNRIATNIYFLKCQSRNNMLFCALYCVLVLRCRQRTTEIKELFYKAMMFKNNPVRHFNCIKLEMGYFVKLILWT